MAQMEDSLSASALFEVKQLADGVWAFLGIGDRKGSSNAGIIDLGDQTLIVDTLEMPSMAHHLKAVAEQLTGRPATYIVITHMHADHWCGNQVFNPSVPIITTCTTRELMPGAVGWLRELQEDPSELEQELEETQARFKAETDPQQRAVLERSIAGIRRWQAMLPGLELRLPNQTFDQKLVFHGTKRTVEVHTVTPGHTASDAYLVLSDEGIMFMGDLGFFDSQPFLVCADPDAWKAWLARMEQSDIEVFVPGHGSLGTKTDLALARQYIDSVQALVARVVEVGGSVDDALEQTLPAPFEAWQRDGQARWEANVRTLYERLSDKVAD